MENTAAKLELRLKIMPPVSMEPFACETRSSAVPRLCWYTPRIWTCTSGEQHQFNRSQTSIQYSPPSPYIYKIRTTPAPRSVYYPRGLLCAFVLSLLNLYSFLETIACDATIPTSCKKAQSVARRLIRLYSARREDGAGSTPAYFNIQTVGAVVVGSRTRIPVPQHGIWWWYFLWAQLLCHSFVVNTNNYKSIKAIHALRLCSIWTAIDRLFFSPQGMFVCAFV